MAFNTSTNLNALHIFDATVCTLQLRSYVQCPSSEPQMRSPSRRLAAPVPCVPTLAGIIACLGALAYEAQSIGEVAAEKVLLDAAQKIQKRLNTH
jgi:hypothetical protein